ncbi:hypothetical protein KR200_008625, partial [Drosophila serrata]
AGLVVKPQAAVVAPKVQFQQKPLKKLPALKPLSQASAVVHRSYAPVIHHAPVTHHVLHHAAPTHTIVSHHVPLLKSSLHHGHHPHAISYVF